VTPSRAAILLYAQATRAGVQFRIDGQALRYSAAPGVLTPEREAKLAALAPELLDIHRSVYRKAWRTALNGRGEAVALDVPPIECAAAVAEVSA
jgi:hypothetical protein